MSKETDKDCSRFLKASTTSLPLLGYADRTWSPLETRTTTTSSCNPHKTTTFSIRADACVYSITSRDVVYETPTPQPLSIKKDVDDDDDDYVSDGVLRVEPHVLDYGAMNVGALASAYVSPYLYESKKRSLDTLYGIRRDGGVFMKGDSQVGVDRDGNIHINNVEFPATKELWELRTRKRVDKDSVTIADIKQYKTISEMTNAHLEVYKPRANIHTSKGVKCKEITSKLFPGGTRQSGVEAALRCKWITYK